MEIVIRTRDNRGDEALPHLQAHLAYMAAIFNVLIALNRQLYPADPLRISIASIPEFFL